MLNEATIFRGAFWSAVGALFERVMFFALPIFIAPLGPSALGIFHLSLRVFHSVIAFPTHLLSIRYTGKLRRYIQDSNSLRFEETAALVLKAHFLSGLALGTIFFILILIFTPVKSMAFLALAIPFAVTSSYIMKLLQLLQRFKKIFIIQVFFIFLFQLLYLMVFIKILGMSIGAAFAGQFFMVVIISIVSFIFIFDRINLLGIFQNLHTKMFLLSRLSFANLLFMTFFPFLDLLIVWALFGTSILGHWVVLLYLPLFIHRIPTTLFSMFFHVAAIKARKNEDITQISKSVFKWILLPTIPLFIVILLFPSEILSVLFHKSYVKDLVITRILAISYLLHTFSWMAEKILVAKNKKIQRVISNYIFASLFILLSLLFASFAPKFFAPLAYGSLASIALAFLISSIFDSLIKYALVLKTARINFIGKNHIMILAAGTIAAILSYVLFLENPLLFIFFFFIMYFVILWIAGVKGQRTISELKKMIAREAVIASD